jgi:hypothetical protein
MARPLPFVAVFSVRPVQAARQTAALNDGRLPAAGQVRNSANASFSVEATNLDPLPGERSHRPPERPFRLAEAQQDDLQNY